jgi:hypothetical protein
MYQIYGNDEKIAEKASFRDAVREAQQYLREDDGRQDAHVIGPTGECLAIINRSEVIISAEADGLRSIPLDERDEYYGSV